MPVFGNGTLKKHLKELNKAIIKNCKEKNADELVKACLKAIRHDLMMIYTGNVEKTKRFNKAYRAMEEIKHFFWPHSTMPHTTFGHTSEFLQHVPTFLKSCPCPSLQTFSKNELEFMSRYSDLRPCVLEGNFEKSFYKVQQFLKSDGKNFTLDRDCTQLLADLAGENLTDADCTEWYRSLCHIRNCILSLTENDVRTYVDVSHAVFTLFDQIFPTSLLQNAIDTEFKDLKFGFEEELKLAQLKHIFRKKGNALMSPLEAEVIIICDFVLKTVKKNKFGTQATIRSSFESLKKELEKIK